MIHGFTGHRPDKLPGGHAHFGAARTLLRRRIADAIARIGGVTYAISGMALGSDTDFALVCVEAGIQFEAALPCDDQARLWPPDAQQRHAALCKVADRVTVISPGPYAYWKMQVRN